MTVSSTNVMMTMMLIQSSVRSYSFTIHQPRTVQKSQDLHKAPRPNGAVVKTLVKFSD